MNHIADDLQLAVGEDVVVTLEYQNIGVEASNLLQWALKGCS